MAGAGAAAAAEVMLGGVRAKSAAAAGLAAEKARPSHRTSAHSNNSRDPVSIR